MGFLLYRILVIVKQVIFKRKGYEFHLAFGGRALDRKLSETSTGRNL